MIATIKHNYHFVYVQQEHLRSDSLKTYFARALVCDWVCLPLGQYEKPDSGRPGVCSSSQPLRGASFICTGQRV